MSDRPRLLTEKCSTCIFRPGNLMHLRPGRVKDMVETTLRGGGTITCHETLPYGEHPDYGEAICRGFYDAYGPQSNYVRICERLGGFAEVPEPGAVR
jgi:hypothetical protein